MPKSADTILFFFFPLPFPFFFLLCSEGATSCYPQPCTEPYSSFYMRLVPRVLRPLNQVLWLPLNSFTSSSSCLLGCSVSFMEEGDAEPCSLQLLAGSPHPCCRAPCAWLPHHPTPRVGSSLGLPQHLCSQPRSVSLTSTWTSGGVSVSAVALQVCLTPKLLPPKEWA